MSSGAVIVSLHDVAPEKYDLVRKQFDDLQSLGIKRMSLLAVPYYHGRKTILEDKTLSNWLHNIQEQGHEIVLHGWLHQKLDALSEGKSFRNWFFDSVYTSKESEFHRLSYEEAHQKIAAGLKQFHQVGLNPRGFIAPAWLMNANVERAAKDHCLIYTNTISEIIHLPSNRRIQARSCVWSTRAAWRRSCSVLWNGILSKKLKSSDVLRVSLHPSDLEYPFIWSQIKDILRAALKSRQPLTYRDWISEAAAIKT